MQRKPIENKYRKGTMKSTLQARMLFACLILLYLYISFNFLHICIHAPQGVKERVKLPIKINRKIIYNHNYMLYFIRPSKRKKINIKNFVKKISELQANCSNPLCIFSNTCGKLLYTLII
jgi:hypothetical protein